MIAMVVWQDDEGAERVNSLFGQSGAWPGHRILFCGQSTVGAECHPRERGEHRKSAHPCQNTVCSIRSLPARFHQGPEIGFDGLLVFLWVTFLLVAGQQTLVFLVREAVAGIKRSG